MSSRKRRRNEHSSGGAVISSLDGRTFVAMIATREGARWGLPKGAIGKHEDSEKAALREVLEETGLRARIVEPLDRIEYQFRAGDTLIQKKVDFYFMQYTGGRLRPQITEVDDVEWVDLNEAVDRASFESEKRILRKAIEKWQTLSTEDREAYRRDNSATAGEEPV